MFSHVYLGTNDPAKSKRFYDAALGALGYQGIGTPGALIYPSDAGTLLIAKPRNSEPATSANGHTLGFNAKSYDEVDAFHAAGIEAGGSSEGEPGFDRIRRATCTVRIFAIPMETSCAPSLRTSGNGPHDDRRVR